MSNSGAKWLASQLLCVFLAGGREARDLSGREWSMGRQSWRRVIWSILILSMVGCGASSQPGKGVPNVRILNVSYDPTREFYREFNEAFAGYWLKAKGQRVEVEQSHGGAGKQARAVMNGLEADVLTLAIGYDIDVMAEKTQLLPAQWQERLPHQSAPYTSTIVFLVRRGNPKNVRDWGDLAREDLEIITPNPKTSGGARWNYLAAWGYRVIQELGGLEKVKDATPEEREKANQVAREFIGNFFRKVPVLDSGARGATSTFLQRGIGDVLLTWENEAYMAMKEAGEGEVEIVIPSISILATPPVTLVDRYADKHGTREVAEAYLKYLYSEEGQSLASKHFFRPVSGAAARRAPSEAGDKIELFQLEEVFGDWKTAQKTHFDDGGSFDQLYQPEK
ncbi:MAG: sulfate ABC transporter substrate-binding protein [Pirellulaceae bacterium]